MRNAAYLRETLFKQGWLVFAFCNCLFVITAGAGQDCPTLVELKEIGAPGTISSSLSSGTIKRWNVYGHGHPIKIKVSSLSMGESFVHEDEPTWDDLCKPSPMLLVVDNKCKLYRIVKLESYHSDRSNWFRSGWRRRIKLLHKFYRSEISAGGSLRYQALLSHFIWRLSGESPWVCTTVAAVGLLSTLRQTTNQNSPSLFYQLKPKNKCWN